MEWFEILVITIVIVFIFLICFRYMIDKIYEIAKKKADAKFPQMIHGRKGTGKTLSIYTLPSLRDETKEESD